MAPRSLDRCRRASALRRRASRGYLLSGLPGAGSGKAWLMREASGNAFLLSGAGGPKPRQMLLGGGWAAWLDPDGPVLSGAPLASLGPT